MAFQAIHDARLFSISIDDNGLGEFTVELHGIGWAVNKMHWGKKVYRTEWNGKDQYLELQEPDADSKMTLPYIYITTVQGDLVPWLCSQTDLLATDWEERS